MEGYQLVGSIRRSLAAIRDHYEAALHAPRGGGISGVRGSKEPPLPVSAHILDARAACHRDLLHYARAIQFICTDIEGGQIRTRLDGDDPIQLAAFIDKWADNLRSADLPEARGCDRDMAEHADDLRHLAQPERREWVNVGHCPLTVARDGESVECGTRLRAYPGKEFITCRGCGHEDTLGWWRTKILGHRPALVTAVDLVDILLIDARLSVEPETIRQWVKRDKVTRAGKDERGRWLYDWAQVVADLGTSRERMGA